MFTGANGILGTGSCTTWFFPKPPGCSALWVTVRRRRLTQLVQPGEKHKNKCKHGASRSTLKIRLQQSRDQQKPFLTKANAMPFCSGPKRLGNNRCSNVAVNFTKRLKRAPKADMSQPNDRGRTGRPSRKLLSNGAICRAVQTLERLVGVCQHFYSHI